MYVAKQPTTWTNLVARLTIYALFGLTLLYPLLIGALLLVRTWWSLSILVVAGSSILWPCKYWPEFGNGVVFAAWRRYLEFKVVREKEEGKEEKEKDSGLVNKSDKSDKSNTMFIALPHGLFPLQLTMLSGVWSRVFSSGIHPSTAIAAHLFKTPILAPMLRWLGCIPAHHADISSALQTNSVLIVPDGIAGTFRSDTEREILYLLRRKGFIKIALQHGSTLVPMYCFGHTQLFHVYGARYLEPISRWLQFSLVAFAGPFKAKQTLIVGAPIKLERILKPTAEQVDTAHAVFVQAVRTLFDTHKKSVPGYENKVLEIE
jgi:1-acyl-sn-glycerol-3-phosphate acyltransferase